jgi:polysaccharide export outer membrane protein
MTPLRAWLKTCLGLAAMIVACANLFPRSASAQEGAQSQTMVPRLDYVTDGRGTSEYLVGPKDVIKITVYRSPDLDTTVQVANDGTIQMGSIGRFKVADLSVSAISRLIEQRLRTSGIFLEPSVNVLVAEYHSRTASVLGAVARPGEYPIDRQNLTVTELLARAGANFENSGALVSIVNPDDPSAAETFYVTDLAAGKRNRPIRAGESVFVQAPASFYISGEVLKDGEYPIRPGLTVDQAISMAGGVTLRGSRKKVSVTRRVGDRSTGERVKVKPNDLVKPDDTILVGARIF